MEWPVWERPSVFAPPNVTLEVDRSTNQPRVAGAVQLRFARQKRAKVPCEFYVCVWGGGGCRGAHGKGG